MAAISRSERYRRIVSVLVEEGFGSLADQIGVRAPWFHALRRDKRPVDEYLAPEERLRRTMERLGPTFAKIGQMLSVRPDLIAPSYATELAKLQDKMEPFPFDQARAEVESVLGAPIGDLFMDFSETPVAAATIGQVYFATLLDGTPVAVKVQRPGVHDVIEADLDILRTQARRVHGHTDFGERHDVIGLVDEFAKAIHEECDYVREGENADRLAALFADDGDVFFPQVHWDRTATTVLTLGRVDGIAFNRLDELDLKGVNRHEAARRGITCYYEQIFIHGFYHADPHPGNLFAMADGRVAFTDFGRCGELTPTARGHVADLLVAIIDQDVDAAADVLLEVSGGVSDVDVHGLKRDVRTLIRKYYDLTLREVDSRELVVEIMSLVGRRGLTMSSEFALLLTTLATLQALGTAIDPQFHFVESVTPFARRIVEEQTSPTALASTVTAFVRRGMRSLQDLPENVNRALRRVGDGDLRMTVRPGGFDPIIARAEQAIDRLAFALVVSAFVVGFSTLLARSPLPWWVQLIADFALVCAAGVGIWFFLLILFRAFRHRRRE